MGKISKNLDGEKLRVIIILIEKVGIVTVVLFGGSYEK
jgi:predicted nucleotidyltransferase